MNYSKITLGEMLSGPHEIIRRNAISILKTYQRCQHKEATGELISNKPTTWKIRCLACGYEWEKYENSGAYTLEKDKETGEIKKKGFS